MKKQASAKEHFDKGKMFIDQNDPDNAISEFTEAISLDPDNSISYFERGYTYLYGKKDYDRAIADYTEAIRINPNYALAYFNRGLTYQNEGDTTKADADFAKAEKLGISGGERGLLRGYAEKNKAYEGFGVD